MAKAEYTRLTDEQSLLKKTAEGSREAFAVLYAHYYPGLYRFISFVIDSHEDTEEIIQDIFLKVWLKRETLIGIRAFDDYLFRMAKNRIFDTARTARTRLKLIRHIGRQAEEPGDPIYNTLLFREYYDIAQKAIHELPQRRQQIFLMNARDEMTAGEIANVLGISKSAVKKQLYEATHFIKDYLRKNADWLLVFIFFLNKY